MFENDIEILLSKPAGIWKLQIPEIGLLITGKYLMDVLEEAAIILEDLADSPSDDE